MKFYLNGKIHRARVTEAKPEYIGSITIDEELMKKAGIQEYEKVLVADVDNGERLETYVIKGKKGEICLNGAAAKKIKKGDTVIIMSFVLAPRPVKPKVILVDEQNRFINYL